MYLALFLKFSFSFKVACVIIIRVGKASSLSWRK